MHNRQRFHRPCPSAIGLILTTFLLSSAWSATEVGGDITENTVWSDPVYQVTSNVRVVAGVTLTISPGTVVKFNAGRRLEADGLLQAIGQSEQRIYFTDIRDDSVGGDTNGDGDATLPEPGGWRGLEATGSGSIHLAHVEVRYAGHNSTYNRGEANIWFRSDGHLSVSDSIIRDGARDGVRVENADGPISINGSQIIDNNWSGVNLIEANGDVEVDDNFIDGNSSNGIRLDGASSQPTLSNNQIGHSNYGILILTPDSHVSIVGNSFDQLATAPLGIQGTVFSDVTWDADETYYVATHIQVRSEATLTIEPGRVVKFGPGRMLNIDGALHAVGTASDPIFFTDHRDDSVGGDTNGDGDATSPEPGGWRGLEATGGGSIHLAHVEVRYAGHNSTYSRGEANIWFRGGGNLSVTGSVIRDGARDGIRVENADGPISINGSQIIDNNWSGVNLIEANGTVEVDDNFIDGNNSNGIRLDGASSQPTLSNNQIGHSNYGILILTPDSQVSIVGNSFDQLATAPLGIQGSVLSDVTWNADETYYVASHIQVRSEATLTIEPGRVVKFGPSRMLDIDGALHAVGTASDPIFFTDRRDDSVGGDTNGDGDATSPEPGGWRGLEATGSGSIELAHVEVRYAGHNSLYNRGEANIWLRGDGHLSVSKSVIRDGARQGIRIHNAEGDVSIENVQIIDNGTVGMDFNQAGVNLAMTGALIEGNGSHGMRVIGELQSAMIKNGIITNNGTDGISIDNAGGTLELVRNRVVTNGRHGIDIQQSSPLLDHNIIEVNSQAGIRIGGDQSEPLVRKNLIRFNQVGIDSHGQANPLIGGQAPDGNDVVDNVDYGVRNQSSEVTINARFNWWGHSSGPYHANDNPTGQGNAVSDWVDFADFLDRSAYDRIFRDRFSSP